MASFFRDSSNNRYYVGKSFTLSGSTYLAGAATEARFTSLGFTKVTVDARPDLRFFDSSGPTISGTWNTTNKDLAELKVLFIDQTKSEEHLLLRSTDHFILNNLEDSGSYPVPADVTTFRSGVRQASTVRQFEINAQVTVTGLAHVVTSGLTEFPLLASGVDMPGSIY